ncbi:hypothetical protein HN51_013428 [Arachis hypogaea]
MLFKWASQFHAAYAYSFLSTFFGSIAHSFSHRPMLVIVTRDYASVFFGCGPMAARLTCPKTRNRPTRTINRISLKLLSSLQALGGGLHSSSSSHHSVVEGLSHLFNCLKIHEISFWA